MRGKTYTKELKEELRSYVKYCTIQHQLHQQWIM